LNATELTAFISTGGAALGAIGAYYASVRSAKTAAVTSTVSTWKDLSAERKIERDEARADLAEIDAKYRARMREMEADYQAQLTAMRARITQLEADLAELTTTHEDRHKWTPP
jgi:phage host-nuclease inhibitor protein Gam